MTAATAPARAGEYTTTERCQTDGMHAFCRRCLATYPGAHIAPALAGQWAAEHVCAPADLTALEAGTGCPDDCIHCGQRTVPAEHGRCHEISGLYACNPDANSWVQTHAEVK